MIDFTTTLTPGATLVLSLSGELDLMSCDYFFDCIQDEIKSGNSRIIIDCADLGHVPSAGLGVLIRARARVKKNNGFIILAALQSHVADLLHFLHLDRVFKIYPSVQAALDAVEKDHTACQ